MAGVHRRSLTAAAAVAATALALSACGGGTGKTSHGPATALAAGMKPQRIVSAPMGLLAAAVPQPNGTMWMLAGDRRSRGLYELDPSNGQVLGSISVSSAAQSVAQSAAGLLGLAVATPRNGALQLLDSHTGRVEQTVMLGAPARQVTVGSDGTTFYVLIRGRSAAGVSIVDSATGRVQGTVNVPRDAVSAVPDVQQSTLYVLQPDGKVSEVGVAGGGVRSTFPIGDSGRSLAISPDGGTLYALKDAKGGENVSVVNIATESVRRVLPAPLHCRELLASASGGQLYEVVGTADYGNLQVFRA